MKTDQMNKRNIRININKIDDNTIRIRVYDSEIKRFDEQCNINNTQEIKLGP